MVVRKFRGLVLASTALAGLAGLVVSQNEQAQAAPQGGDAKCADQAAGKCAPGKKNGAASADSTYLTPLVVSGAPDSGGVGDPYAQPKAVSTIGSDEINQFGGQNLDNALRATPGTFTQDNPQNPGMAVNIRGLEDYGRVNMEIDGARQNFRFTGHDAAGLTYVDPALLGGIDITRGASDGLGGAGELAGIANFRTLEADDLIKDGKGWGGFTSLTAGTNGDGVSEAAAAAFRVSDTFTLLGAVSKRNPQDYGNAGGNVVPGTAQDILSGLVKAEITPTLDSKLTVSALDYNDNFTADGYQQTVNNQTYTAHYDYTPADNPLVDFHAGAYYNDTRMDYLAVDPNDPNAAIPIGPGMVLDLLPDVGRVIDDKGWGINAYNTSRGSLGDVDIASTYGVEYAHDHADVTEPGAGAGVNPTGNSDLASVFSSTTLTRGIVQVTGGLRYDYFSANGVVPSSAANADPSFSGPSSLSGGRLDPSITLALNPVDWFQPYVSYSESYRPPSVSELYAGGEHPGGFVLFGANPNLQPETARNWEAGANFRFDGIFTGDDSLRFKADYFHMDVDNYITGNLFDSGVVDPIFGPIPGSYFVNNPGTSHIQGVEIQAAYDAGSYFGSLAYTHTNTDIPAPQGLGVIGYTPDDVLTATVGVRLLEQRQLTLGGRVTAVSSSNQGIDPESGAALLALPGYSLVDVFGNYKFSNGVELGATVSNVFNASYTPALSTTPDEDVVGGTGRGRTFEATLKASF